MHRPEFTIEKNKIFFKLLTACFLIFITGINTFAQYKGAPVKKERLIKALKSRQLQTGDIVTIINRNGVDFRLTEEVKKALIAAGARPEVINAVAQNQRSANDEFANSKRRQKSSVTNYDDLLDQAIYTYRDQKNPKGAIRILESAVKMNPKDPKAYQMLGYINLYGLNNPAQAEKFMRQSIENGGSAVFRVYHDDKGSFTERCSGSLYISPESMRFESDDNIHTFETSTVNIEKIKLDRESSKIWKNHTIFKVYLQIGKTDAKFRFAPITANEEESKMVARMVIESRLSRKPVGTAINFVR
jgi:tetratricopeptide (TPR) repeat protein